VTLLVQLLHPALWGDVLHASIDGIGRGAFWADVLQIVIINILLSGDNALVIAMACRGLAARQRFWGMVIGTAVAVLLRLVFTTVIGQLMLLPYLKLTGGLALIYVAAKLVVPERAARNEVAAVAQLWRAVWIVVVADIVMSLDNVIAIAAVAQGSFILLAIGLVASIPIIIAGAAIVMVMLDRFPVFVWAGAGLLGWIAGDVMTTDPVVSGYMVTKLGATFAQQVAIAASGAGVLLVLGVGGLWRQFALSKIHARSPGEESSGT
jgi:YjbE family integral membrane protein